MPLPIFAQLARRFQQNRSCPRRSFFRAAAFGSTLLLSNRNLRARTELPRRVVIVGAGLGGLACAYELKAAGYQVILLEARGRIGGRVLTFKDFVPHKTAEGGGEFIGANHPLWNAYAKKFGLSLLEVHADNDLAMPIYLNGEQLAKHEAAQVYDEMEIALSTLNHEAESIDSLRPWLSPRAAEFDRRTLASWIDSLRVSDRVRRLIGIQLASDNGVANERGSYLAMLAVVQGGGGERYWTESEFYRCAGGNDQLAHELADEIGAEQIVVNAPVEEIRRTETGATVLDISGRAWPCDDVVLAVPPSVWHRIAFTPALPNELTPQTGPALKYLALTKSAFWRAEGQSQYALTDEAISQTWDLADGQNDEYGEAALAAFSGGPQAIKCETFARVERDAKYREEFERVYPHYKAHFLAGRMLDWPRDPLTRCGYSFPAPGEIMRLGPILFGGLERLHFCGEHASYRFGGFMEGALDSGVRVASQLAKRDGLID